MSLSTVVTPIDAGRRRTIHYLIRLNAQELALIKRLRVASGMPTSVLIRQLLRDYAAKTLGKRETQKVSQANSLLLESMRYHNGELSYEAFRDWLSDAYFTGKFGNVGTVLDSQASDLNGVDRSDEDTFRSKVADLLSS